jgi:hypothetical protein
MGGVFQSANMVTRESAVTSNLIPNPSVYGYEHRAFANESKVPSPLESDLKIPNQDFPDGRRPEVFLRKV